jgi:hypothetical protein
MRRPHRRALVLLVVVSTVGVAGCSGHSVSDLDRVARSVPVPSGLTFTGISDETPPRASWVLRPMRRTQTHKPADVMLSTSRRMGVDAAGSALDHQRECVHLCGDRHQAPWLPDHRRAGQCNDVQADDSERAITSKANARRKSDRTLLPLTRSESPWSVVRTSEWGTRLTRTTSRSPQAPSQTSEAANPHPAPVRPCPQEVAHSDAYDSAISSAGQVWPL